MIAFDARGKGISKDGFKEAAAVLLGHSDLRLQLITEAHQLIHLRDDAVLLSERGKRERQVQYYVSGYVLHRRAHP